MSDRERDEWLALELRRQAELSEQAWKRSWVSAEDAFRGPVEDEEHTSP